MKRNSRNFCEGKLVIFFTISISVIALMIWFFLHLAAIEKYKIRNGLETESTRVERALIDRIEHTSAIINNINSQIARSPHDAKHINKILEKFKSTPELSDTFSWTIFSWANAQNQITVDANYGILKETIDLSSRDYIAFTKSEPNKFHLGKPVFGSTSKKWMIPGGVGIVDKNGKYLGATTIGFEIDSLARSLHQAIQNDNIGLELFGFDGTPILYANNHSFGSSEKSQNHELKTTILSSKNNTQIDVNLFDNTHGILVKKLGDLPYFLVLKYSSKAINNGLWQGFFSRSVEIFCLFFIAAFLLIFIYKREELQRQKIRALRKIVAQTRSASKK